MNYINKKLNIFFFTLFILISIIFIFQGLDYTDTGFHLLQQENIFFGKQVGWPINWYADFNIKILFYPFLKFGVIGSRIGVIILNIFLIFIFYDLLKKIPLNLNNNEKFFITTLSVFVYSSKVGTGHLDYYVINLLFLALFFNFYFKKFFIYEKISLVDYFSIGVFASHLILIRPKNIILLGLVFFFFLVKKEKLRPACQCELRRRPVEDANAPR